MSEQKSGFPPVAKGISLVAQQLNLPSSHEPKERLEFIEKLEKQDFDDYARLDFRNSLSFWEKVKIRFKRNFGILVFMAVCFVGIVLAMLNSNVDSNIIMGQTLSSHKLAVMLHYIHIGMLFVCVIWTAVFLFADNSSDKVLSKKEISTNHYQEIAEVIPFQSKVKDYVQQKIQANGLLTYEDYMYLNIKTLYFQVSRYKALGHEEKYQIIQNLSQ